MVIKYLKTKLKLCKIQQYNFIFNYNNFLTLTLISCTVFVSIPLTSLSLDSVSTELSVFPFSSILFEVFSSALFLTSTTGGTDW